MANGNVGHAWSLDVLAVESVPRVPVRTRLVTDLRTFKGQDLRARAV